jgi:ABC-type molybdenum transport system ATPase subunit/photorepair protein PhrA
MSKTYIPASLRRLVVERARNCCEYCLIPQEIVLAKHQVDHVIAEKHGGAASPTKPIHRPMLNNSSNSPLLIVNNICAGYSQGDIIKDISFQITPNTITLGGNGSGKSTLLRDRSTVDQPSLSGHNLNTNLHASMS